MRCKEFENDRTRQCLKQERVALCKEYELWQSGGGGREQRAAISQVLPGWVRDENEDEERRLGINKCLELMKGRLFRFLFYATLMKASPVVYSFFPFLLLIVARSGSCGNGYASG